MSDKIRDIIKEVGIDNLKEFVKSMEGLRHGWENYNILCKKAEYIQNTLRSFNLNVENQEFNFHDRSYCNISGKLKGVKQDNNCLLIGAHYDAAWGSPGADDNASGIAVLLESARILSKQSVDKSVEFVAFTLEEPQPQTIHFLIGSEYFAGKAKKQGIGYDAVFILESVGYTDNADRSQIVPVFVRIPVSEKGNFLGIIANSRSKNIMNSFSNISGNYVPELPMISYKVPFSGRFVPETRFSDHASFWKYGYPALMLTDTAMFRNPFYHTSRDKFETLDFEFMTKVTKAVISVILRLGNNL